jgi:Outer membrane lipoprotein carrier protein LolA
MYIKNPGKSRIETKTQGQLAIVIVSDGDFIWTYNPSARQYTKTAAAMGMPGVLGDLNSIDIQSVMSGAKPVRERFARTELKSMGRRDPAGSSRFVSIK